MIKGVIFDYDGVIGDTFLTMLKTHNRVVEILKRGKPLTPDEFEKIDFTNWEKFYKEHGFSDEEIENLSLLFLEEFMKISHESTLFDGISDVIEELHREFKLAIASNGNKKRIMHHLNKHNLLDCFNFIIGPEAGKLKPDPHQLHACMEVLKIRPEETCFVGDTSEDILAGRSAKVAKIIAVSYGYHPENKLQGADAIAHCPEDIVKIINRWNKC